MNGQACLSSKPFPFLFQSSVCSPLSLSKMMAVEVKKIEMAPVSPRRNVRTKGAKKVEVVPQGSKPKHNSYF